jgi:acid stress-induced BolA-like protein IbaG/YrbA
MLSTDQVKSMIENRLPGARVEVNDLTGTGDHFEATVVCPAFDGLSLIKQHQLVYAALGDAMGGAVHALKLKTMTPAQAQGS